MAVGSANILLLRASPTRHYAAALIKVSRWLGFSACRAGFESRSGGAEGLDSDPPMLTQRWQVLRTEFAKEQVKGLIDEIHATI